MLTGMLMMWFVLTLGAVIFVIYDLLTNTPEAGVMKFAWVLVVMYTGPVGLFVYFMSCREPMPGTHEEFVKPLWKQAAGSEVHCLAGDATGIIIAAVTISFFTISAGMEMFLEYAAGFIVGLFIFQALFMKDMMGGSYLQALKSTFFSEWLSMNMIMAGMIPAMMIWRYYDVSAADPMTLSFWGSMSLATIIGGLLAFPINRWLVANGLKHGMATVRPEGQTPAHEEHTAAHSKHVMTSPSVTAKELTIKTIITLVFLAAGIMLSLYYS